MFYKVCSFSDGICDCQKDDNITRLPLVNCISVINYVLRELIYIKILKQFKLSINLTLFNNSSNVLVIKEDALTCSHGRSLSRRLRLLLFPHNTPCSKNIKKTLTREHLKMANEWTHIAWNNNLIAPPKKKNVITFKKKHPHT